MIKVKDGYAKLIGTTYEGSANRVLLSNGGDHVLGNASGNIPLSNGTVNTNLNADMLDGVHLEDIVKSGYVYSNTENLTSYWGKLWEHTLTGNENTDLTLYLHSAYSDIRGIIHISTRKNNSTVDGVTTYSMSVWVTQIAGNIPTDRVRLYYNNSGLCLLWVNVNSRWGVFNCRVISCTSRTSSEYKLIGTLFKTNLTTEQTLPTDNYKTLTNQISYATVKQHSTSNTEYPLVWSNLTNTNTITADLLHKSYSHLTYNPSAHKITTGLFVANNSAGPHFTGIAASGGWAYIRLNNSTCYWDIATNNSSGSGGLWLSRYKGEDHGIFVSTTSNVGINTANPGYKLHVNGTGAFTLSLHLIEGAELHLKAPANSTDPGDIVFKDGNNIEIGRIFKQPEVNAFNVRFSASDSAKTILHSGNYSYFLDSRYYTETEVNNKLAGYLPLSGGTMTGSIKLVNYNYLFGNVAHDVLPDNNGYLTVYSINNGTVLGAFGDGTTANIATYIRSTGDNLYHRKGNYNFYNDYKIWDSGNDGSGSGLDADLLDGYHISVTSSPGTDSSTLYFVL